MATKKYIIYYNESNYKIGYREHHFDWKEGDDIIDGGTTCTIFAIFDGTPKNMRIVKTMMQTIKRYHPSYARPTCPKISAVEALEILKGQGLDATIPTVVKTWKSFDAMLDYVDEVVATMD